MVGIGVCFAGYYILHNSISYMGKYTNSVRGRLDYNNKIPFPVLERELFSHALQPCVRYPILHTYDFSDVNYT